MNRARARRHASLSLALYCGVVGIAGCARAATAAAVRPANSHHEVVIEGFVFRPESLVVSPGDTIEWINRDLFDHSATSADKRFDSGVLAKSGHATFVATDTGRHPYHCALHPTMEGTIIVR